MSVKKRENFDNLEQYGRRQNLKFVGIPYKKDENLTWRFRLKLNFFYQISGFVSCDGI